MNTNTEQNTEFLWKATKLHKNIFTSYNLEEH
jgi:hypothetical protein